MSVKILQFWFSFGSTYTYLSTHRIEKFARARDIGIEWYPFILKRISSGSGNQSNPRKVNYMWRDLKRRADRHGLEYNKPAIYPVDYQLTARVALIGSHEGWCPEFTKLVFRWNFVDGRQIGVEKNLEAALHELGKDPEVVIAKAQSGEIAEAMQRQIDKAVSLGIFGSPNFIAGDELFWGDDRLEEALDWCVTH